MLAAASPKGLTRRQGMRVDIPPCTRRRRSARPQRAVVKALLDAGADPSVRADGGVIPVELVPDDSPLRGTDVYWRLNEGRYR